MEKKKEKKQLTFEEQFESNKKIHNDIDLVGKAALLLDDIKIICLENEDNDMLYLQDKKTLVYKPLDMSKLKVLVYKKLEEEGYSLKEESVNTIVNTMRTKGYYKDIKDYNEIKNNILVNNGFIKITDNGIKFVEVPKERLEYTYCLKRIDLDYKPDLHKEENTLVNKFMSDIMCEDKELIDYLWHSLATPFMNRTKYEKAFIFYGETGANGKTILSEFMRSIYAKRNITHVELAEMKEYNLAVMDKGFINWVQDLEKYDSWTNFKKIVTGESVVVNVKYADPIEKELSTQIFINSNILPNLGAKRDGGYIRRLEFIPFNRTFKGKDKDTQILTKLTTRENQEWTFSKLISIANEMSKDIAGSWFEENRPEIVKKLLQEQKVSDSTAIAFMEWIKDNIIFEENNIKLETNEFYIEQFGDYIGKDHKTKGKILSIAKTYKIYKSYCENIGQKPLNKNNFETHIKETGVIVRHEDRINTIKGLYYIDALLGENNE